MMRQFASSFLGNSPVWYKIFIVLCLIFNPIIFTHNHFVAGWLLLAEFIFTLAMALKCYPLQPGGLLALEAIIINMASPNAVYNSLVENFPVILLLIFMVAAIYFMKDLLSFIFLRFLTAVHSKLLLSFIFCLSGAVLSAFLDALTVTAVIIAAIHSIYDIYHKAVTDNLQHTAPNPNSEDLEQFRAFLRSLLMHGAVGTALGGVTTLVGEPQNLLIATHMKWSFADFFYQVAPVSMPTLIAGLTTCLIVEQFKLFGFGQKIPMQVKAVLTQNIQTQQLSDKTKLNIIIQAILAVLLIFSLAFHVASVGLLGLALMILVTSFTGITEEHQLGKAFTESLPFTALLSGIFCNCSGNSSATVVCPAN